MMYIFEVFKDEKLYAPLARRRRTVCRFKGKHLKQHVSRYVFISTEYDLFLAFHTFPLNFRFGFITPFVAFTLILLASSTLLFPRLKDGAIHFPQEHLIPCH